MKAKPKPTSVDGYLASLNDEQRVTLEKLRKTIRAAAPQADECISYNIPAYRQNGRLLVAFAAAKKHCSFFPGALPVTTHKAELKGYSTSKGTVRFPPDQPLPAALVRKLVKTRIAERGTAS